MIAMQAQEKLAQFVKGLKAVSQVLLENCEETMEVFFSNFSIQL